MSVFDRCLNRYSNARDEEMTIQEYLELCKKDSSSYASVAERIVSMLDGRILPPTVGGDPDLGVSVTTETR